MHPFCAYEHVYIASSHISLSYNTQICWEAHLTQRFTSVQLGCQMSEEIVLSSCQNFPFLKCYSNFIFMAEWKAECVYLDLSLPILTFYVEIQMNIFGILSPFKEQIHCLWIVFLLSKMFVNVVSLQYLQLIQLFILAAFQTFGFCLTSMLVFFLYYDTIQYHFLHLSFFSSLIFRILYRQLL